MAYAAQQNGGWSGPVNHGWYAGNNACGNYTGTVNNSQGNHYYMIDNSRHTNVNQRYDPHAQNVYNSSTMQTNDPRRQHLSYSSHPNRALGNGYQQPPDPPPSHHTFYAAQPLPYNGSSRTGSVPSQTPGPPPTFDLGSRSSRPPPPATPPTLPSELAIKVRPCPSSRRQAQHDQNRCRVEGCHEIHVHRTLYCEEQQVRSGWRGERLETVWVAKKIKSAFCQRHTCQRAGAGGLGQFCPCPRYPWDLLCSCCAAKEERQQQGHAARR